jgi:ribonuclease R
VLPRDAEVLERLRKKSSRVLSFADLVEAFGVRDAEEDALREKLDLLERRGEIVRVRGEKYSAIEFSNLVSGRLTVRPEGFGFVLAEEGDDLFGPRSGMHGAMDGDTVLAREERSRATGRGRDAGRRSGTVVRVLERARERVVGRFETRRPQGRSPARDRRDRRIPTAAHGALGGNRRARLTTFPDARRVACRKSSMARIPRQAGSTSRSCSGRTTRLRGFAAGRRRLRQFPEEVRHEDLRGRRDFRERRIVTIDGETAKDFDDAIEVEKTPSGYRIGVHIADVSHYVTEGSGLDDEARSRGTSVYFPGASAPGSPACAPEPARRLACAGDSGSRRGRPSSTVKGHQAATG